jgi:transposase
MSDRIRNWSEYNAALKQRGSLTFWIEESVLESWIVPNLSGKPGVSIFYSDLAIMKMVTLKSIYRLAGRQCQGFVESIFELMDIDLSVSDHSTLSRRLGNLSITLPVLPKEGGKPVVVDSAGVKVYGEGEWKTRQHGISMRRTWRKLHLGINEETGEIVAMYVTTNDISDGQVLPHLLEQIEREIDQVSGDGAYDQAQCYDAIGERKAQTTIPPRRGAKIWKHGNTKGERHNRSGESASRSQSGTESLETGEWRPSSIVGRNDNVPI